MRLVATSLSQAMHSYSFTLAIVSLSTVAVTEARTNYFKYTRTNVDQGGKYTNISQSYTLPSVMSCSLQCGLSDTCLGINYNNETSSCDLVADTSTPPVETLGWNAYIQSTPIKIYLRPCLANASCSNEGCSDTQCNCLSTYKYNWRSGQCVTECTRGYGTTFIEFKDGTFNAPSNFDISGVSVNECAEFCLNTTISPPCEGFSYGSSNGLCRLKEGVPTTDGDYFLGTGLFHYMRNCF